MTHNALEKIFGSSSRVKIMKLFLFNDQSYFDKDDVSTRTKVSGSEVQKELKLLSEISLIKSRVITKLHKTKTDKIIKKKVVGYSLNPNFNLLKHLKNLLINNEPLQHTDILKRIGKELTPLEKLPL
jgi:hypothetical protein